jgi:hypothetical protein
LDIQCLGIYCFGSYYPQSRAIVNSPRGRRRMTKKSMFIEELGAMRCSVVARTITGSTLTAIHAGRLICAAGGPSSWTVISATLTAI